MWWPVVTLLELKIHHGLVLVCTLARSMGAVYYWCWCVLHSGLVHRCRCQCRCRCIQLLHLLLWCKLLQVEVALLTLTLAAVLSVVP